MEHFESARTVRLRNSHGKYLWADEDAVGVCQERDSGSSSMAVWAVEVVDPVSEGEPAFAVRLRSCFNSYLTASSEPFLLGMTGRKVVQSARQDSSVEWEPVPDQNGLVKLRTPHGNYLRANGGLPPWRNSVTHDVPVRSATQSWVLWQVELLEPLVRQPAHLPERLASKPKLEMQLSFKIPKSDGRLISYTLLPPEQAQGGGEEKQADESQWPSFYFKGHSVTDLAAGLKQELGIDQEVTKACLTMHPCTSLLYRRLGESGQGRAREQEQEQDVCMDRIEAACRATQLFLSFLLYRV